MSLGVDPKQLSKELKENTEYLKISSTPNEYGEFVIDFNGTEEELLERLNCIRLVDALKRFTDLKAEITLIYNTEIS